MKKENSNIKGKAYYLALKTKYLNAAKEASSSGDRILKEYNLQFAEHYSRVIAEKFPIQNSNLIQPPSQPIVPPTEQNEEPPIENKAKCAKRPMIKKAKIENKNLETNS